jgi:SAM-dependent methyltransferase
VIACACRNADDRRVSSPEPVTDLARHFVIREYNHRIHNPFDDAKLATLGAALHLEPGMSILDLACGSGEMLATWSRDYGIVGTGVDISTHFLARARDRAAELGVADRLAFVHGDAGAHVSPVPVDAAACLGATWIGGGVDGTVALLDRSLRSGGVMLIGEPYWLKPPPNQDVVAACHAQSIEDFDDLPGLIRRFGRLGWDLVELVLTDPSGWDRYHGAQWRTIRLWLDQNPHDELAPAFREELSSAPLAHIVCREYLGWGVFALMKR